MNMNVSALSKSTNQPMKRDDIFKNEFTQITKLDAQKQLELANKIVGFDGIKIKFCVDQSISDEFTYQEGKTGDRPEIK